MKIKIKRLGAAMIDFYIICLVATLIAMFLNGGITEHIIRYIIIYCVVFFLLFLFKDNVFGNASIGKKILGIHIICTVENQSCTIMNLKRTLPFILLPIEVLLIVVDNLRLGDIWADTLVVETKNRNT